MKTQINEIKRMQQLAGIISESQLNEVFLGKEIAAEQYGQDNRYNSLVSTNRGEDKEWAKLSRDEREKIMYADTDPDLASLLTNLEPNEKTLVAAVVGDINEAIDLGKVLKKVKLLANKGFLTVAMASAILSSCGTAGNSNEMFKRELENAKKVDSIENVQKARIDSVLNTIKP